MMRPPRLSAPVQKWLFRTFDAIVTKTIDIRNVLSFGAMAPPPSHSQSLLPNPGILILDRVERDADRFRLMVHVEQEPTCPLCGEVSRSRHSCYCRYLQDLPWQGVSVQLWATVGRFRCRNSSCPRKIFCERLPQIARVLRASNRAGLRNRTAGRLRGRRPSGPATPRPVVHRDQ